MATNTEIKEVIDQEINNKTENLSINHVSVGNLLKSIIDYTDQEIENIPDPEVGPQGPQGVQGVQGPQGTAGPIGPAGLTWKGEWNPLTDYIEDDAVGYNGASWFNISAVAGEPTNDSPNIATGYWALLAAQGTPGNSGETGAQGPQGPQGPAGALASLTSNGVTLTTTAQVLPFDINSLSFQGGKAFLPSGAPVGKEIIVLANSNNIEIYANENQNLALLFLTFGSNTNKVVLKTNDIFKFTLLGFGGYWLAQKVMPIDLEFIAQVFQSGTDNPIVQQPAKNTLQFSGGGLSRAVNFERLGIGLYQVGVYWSTTTPNNANNLSIFFGDKTVKFEGGVSVGNIDSLNYKIWKFSTYNNAGVLADNQLIGNNGGYFRITLSNSYI